MSDFHTDYRNQLERAVEAVLPRERSDSGPGVRRPHTRRPSRRLTLGGAIAAVAGLSVLAGLAFTGGEDQPAYAVALRSDGSVSLTLSEIVGVEPANARMAKLGVPVRLARAEEGCTARGRRVSLSQTGPAAKLRAPTAPPGSRRRREEVIAAMRLRSESGLARLLRMAQVQRGAGKPGAVRMIIHPAAVPSGDTLLLAFRATGRGVGGSIGLYRNPAPACVRLR